MIFFFITSLLLPDLYLFLSNCQTFGIFLKNSRGKKAIGIKRENCSTPYTFTNIEVEFINNLIVIFLEEMAKQYHLRRTTFIRTKYLTFQNFKTISTGFGKIKDQKMEITFTLIRKFTVCTMAKTELLYLKNVGA